MSWPDGDPYDPDANEDIAAFEMVLYTDDDNWWGEYELDLYVELEDYPEATYSY